MVTSYRARLFIATAGCMSVVALLWALSVHREAHLSSPGLAAGPRGHPLLELVQLGPEEVARSFTVRTDPRAQDLAQRLDHALLESAPWLDIRRMGPRSIRLHPGFRDFVEAARDCGSAASGLLLSQFASAETADLQALLLLALGEVGAVEDEAFLARILVSPQAHTHPLAGATAEALAALGGQVALDALSSNLDGTDSTGRAAVLAQALATLGERAVPSLLGEVERRVALGESLQPHQYLGALSADVDAATIVGLASHPVLAVRAMAAHWKITHGAGLSEVRDLLSTENGVEVRRAALRALGQGSRKDAAGLVSELLDDPELREDAARVLGTCGTAGTAALNQLIAGLPREDPLLPAALSALFAGGEPAGVETALLMSAEGESSRRLVMDVLLSGVGTLDPRLAPLLVEDLGRAQAGGGVGPELGPTVRGLLRLPAGERAGVLSQIDEALRAREGDALAQRAILLELHSSLEPAEAEFLASRTEAPDLLTRVLVLDLLDADRASPESQARARDEVMDALRGGRLARLALVDDVQREEYLGSLARLLARTAEKPELEELQAAALEATTPMAKSLLERCIGMVRARQSARTRLGAH